MPPETGDLGAEVPLLIPLHITIQMTSLIQTLG